MNRKSRTHHAPYMLAWPLIHILPSISSQKRRSFGWLVGQLVFLVITFSAVQKIASTVHNENRSIHSSNFSIGFVSFYQHRRSIQGRIAPNPKSHKYPQYPQYPQSNKVHKPHKSTSYTNLTNLTSLKSFTNTNPTYLTILTL